MTQPSTYKLRLPRSIRAEVERPAKLDGTSSNRFIATAVADKLTATFLPDRRALAGFAAFDRLMAIWAAVMPAASIALVRCSPGWIAVCAMIRLNGSPRSSHLPGPTAECRSRDGACSLHEQPYQARPFWPQRQADLKPMLANTHRPRDRLIRVSQREGGAIDVPDDLRHVRQRLRP